MACWSVTAEAAKYDIAIQWMRRLLWSSKSDTSRLQNRIGLIKQSIPEFLRDPETAIADVAAEVLYTSKSTSRAAAGRQLVKWIPEFERHFKRDPKRVIQELESIRDMRTLPRESCSRYSKCTSCSTQTLWSTVLYPRRYSCDTPT